MRSGRVDVSVRVRARPERVWAALTDWESQGAWMTATTVRAVDGGGQGVGGRIEAFTGFGRFGFLDTMEVTTWRPPRCCVVRHAGAVVRGTGGFEVVEALDEADGSTVTWYENLELPGGALGAFGFTVARPVLEFLVLRSLKRFARLVEGREAGESA